MALLEAAVEPDEIVAALTRYGLSQRDIATAAGVSERTVHTWKHHGPVRGRNYDHLAAIRDVAMLLQDSLTERGVGHWLRARNRLLDRRRPVDVLHDGDTDAVQQAAAAFAEGVYV